MKMTVRAMRPHTGSGSPANAPRPATTTPAATAVPAGTAAPAQAEQPVRTPRIGITLIAAVAFGAEMAVSARYGYARDELYFLAGGYHFAAGYVDQPPLTPVLARLSAALSGNTLVGFRVLPALAWPRWSS